MLRTRVIPVLLLKNSSLVKTVRFATPKYIGDPINTSKIFNELEIDELCILDIGASRENKRPNYDILKEIGNECFMPLSYGGGITTLSDADKLFNIGFEKIIINTASFTQPKLIEDIATVFGSQAVCVAIDVKKTVLGGYQVYGSNGSVNYKFSPASWAKEIEIRGAGEILLTNIDREGTWKGFDLNLIEMVTANTNLPVIVHGGAGCIKDIGDAVKLAGASAVALGSMVVYQRKGMGVLVNFPDRSALEHVLT